MKPLHTALFSLGSSSVPVCALFFFFTDFLLSSSSHTTHLLIRQIHSENRWEMWLFIVFYCIEDGVKYQSELSIRFLGRFLDGAIDSHYWLALWGTLPQTQKSISSCVLLKTGSFFQRSFSVIVMRLLCNRFPSSSKHISQDYLLSVP